MGQKFSLTHYPEPVVALAFRQHPRKDSTYFVPVFRRKIPINRPPQTILELYSRLPTKQFLCQGVVGYPI
jgi:hypothetical protein